MQSESDGAQESYDSTQRDKVLASTKLLISEVYLLVEANGPEVEVSLAKPSFLEQRVLAYPSQSLRVQP